MWTYGPMGSMGWWMAVVALCCSCGWLLDRWRILRRDDETPEQILKRRYAKGEIEARNTSAAWRTVARL